MNKTQRVSPAAERRVILVFVISALAVVTGGMSFTACGPTATPTLKLTPLTVQLRWTHQAQFAGFYAAEQNGYYRDEGLAVTFLPGGPTVDMLKPVLDGTAEFGVVAAHAVIEARSQGQPLRAIAAVYRRNPTVFIALADSGITRPQDFVGKTIQVNPFGRPMLHAIMALVGIHTDQYSEVSLPDNLAALQSGKAQVTIAYVTNEAIALKDAGHRFSIIYPDDYGVHSYGDTIVTTDDMIEKKPELVLRFLRATLKGWTYAIENPVPIAAMVAKYNPQTNPEHETAQMTASIPLVNTGEDNIGWMKPEIWAGMETTLREQDVLTQAVDVTQAYTLRFLREIYGK